MNRNSVRECVVNVRFHLPVGPMVKTVFALTTFALLFAKPLQAATVIFDNNASFDSNFYKSSGPGGATKLTQTGSTLRFAPATGQTNATAIYNTSTTGGTGGNGGTALAAPLNLFAIDASGIVLEADFKASNFDTSNGLGIYFGLNNDATSGALAIFRLSATTGSGNADVRFYTGANPTASSNVGTISGASTNSFETTLTDLSKYYTFQLTLTLDGANVVMVTKLFDGGIQLGNTVEKSVLASSVSLNGQVGLRLGGAVGTTEDVARFSVYAVPEPGMIGMLGVALGTLLLIFKARSRRI